MKRYNFDRYKDGKLMAMGVAVHAKSSTEAMRQAHILNNDATETLIFTDHTKCITQCKICGV